MIEKTNLNKTNAWPFVEAKKILQEKKTSIEKKGKITLQTGYGPRKIRINVFFIKNNSIIRCIVLNQKLILIESFFLYS